MNPIRTIQLLTELKEELVEVAEIDKSVEDVSLYFSFRNDTLTVHDYENQQDSMEVAIILEEDILFSVGDLCDTEFYEVIISLLEEERGVKKIAKRLNKLVEQYGF